MNIQNIFNQINSLISNNQVPNEVSADTLKNNLYQNGLNSLLDLVNGSLVSGEVISLKDNNLVLKLANNQMVNASLDGNVVPSEGQKMTFMVNNSSQGTVTLSPLYVNTSVNSNISNALLMANLQDNPSNQYIVKSMMEEGLPIDKNSLINMTKLTSMYPEVDPKDIAIMNRLNIPVNDNMVEQFLNYKNYEHQISNSIIDITDSLTESYSMILDAQSFDEAATFIKDTVNVLFDDLTENDFTNNVDLNITNLNNENGNENSINSDYQTNTYDISANNESNNINKIINDIKVDNKINELINTLKEVLVDEKNTADNNVDISMQDASKTANSFKQNLNSLLDELIKQNSDGNLDDKSAKNIIKSLLDNENFKNIFKDNITNKLLLNPENVSEKNSVKDLYEHINTQMKNLAETITKDFKQDLPIHESVNNTLNNIEFMNELNQTFNYVQIPLKLNNQEASGELYVYTNKKSLAQNDGNVSALLHLDMDNLGPLDVHVLLNQFNNVKTKFFLKDDASLDIIAQNIDILNERLNKRGYQMDAEFVNNNEKTIFEQMTDNGPVNIISHNAFDARA